jgi:hypothetical protein
MQRQRRAALHIKNVLISIELAPAEPQSHGNHKNLNTTRRVVTASGAALVRGGVSFVIAGLQRVLWRKPKATDAALVAAAGFQESLPPCLLHAALCAAVFARRATYMFV